MKMGIKALFPNAALKWRAYHRLIRNQDSYLYLSGWMNSLEAGKPMNHEGKAIPWLPFGFVNFLDERLHKNLTIFEYGCGFSTRFYAERVKHVTSVEHDQAWYEHIKLHMPANVTLKYHPLNTGDTYSNSISAEDTSFDFIMVDGRQRVACIKKSLPSLSKRGVIVLDDSLRERYQEGIDYLRNQGFRVLHFEGMKPKGTGLNRTTLFYRDGNCLNI